MKNNKVLILMSTYNGEKFIEEQLNSILNQKNIKFDILIRDDCSTDNTCQILDNYSKNYNNIQWYCGENLKPAKSFMELIEKAPLDYDYYAFSDQDDYWEEDKLEIAVSNLNKLNSEIPNLYYGSPRLADKNLNKIQSSKYSKEYMTSFEETIIESNCTGCTMVFNKALVMKLKREKIRLLLHA